MHLEYIIYIKVECLGDLKKYKNNFVIIGIDETQVEKCLGGSFTKENSLLIASTDSTIALGKELGIATLAYMDPDFPNQTYSGVEMIVEGFEEVDADFLEKVFQRYHHIPWTILETERCIVRELCMDDLDGLFELYAGDGMDE